VLPLTVTATKEPEVDELGGALARAVDAALEGFSSSSTLPIAALEKLFSQLSGERLSTSIQRTLRSRLSQPLRRWLSASSSVEEASATLSVAALVFDPLSDVEEEVLLSPFSSLL